MRGCIAVEPERLVPLPRLWPGGLWEDCAIKPVLMKLDRDQIVGLSVLVKATHRTRSDHVREAIADLLRKYNAGITADGGSMKKAKEKAWKPERPAALVEWLGKPERPVPAVLPARIFDDVAAVVKWLDDTPEFVELSDGVSQAIHVHYSKLVDGHLPGTLECLTVVRADAYTMRRYKGAIHGLGVARGELVAICAHPLDDLNQYEIYVQLKRAKK